MLEEMSYEIAGQKFGMRRSSDGDSYEFIPHGSGPDESDPVWDERQSIPSLKFHHFPYRSDMEVQIRKFLFDLQYELDVLFRYLYYLGPLRAYPNRIYTRSGAQPIDMGAAGELVVDAILSSRERGDEIRRDLEEDEKDSALTIDRYVAQWLSRLDLAQDFRVETLAEARRIFEVRVRNSRNSSEVLLTDIGFGVSQILPVLVLCFYVPMTSTIILEQPEIHLHPAAQSGLADVFVDAWRSNRTQILFESHSEHVLRRFQRRIAEGDLSADDIALYFCSTGRDGASKIEALKVDEFGNICNWPSNFFGDQFGEISAMSQAALARRQVD